MPAAIEPALGLLALDSIAAGIAAGDAMAKRAPIDVIHAGTIHPGRYLVLVAGAVADVEEALDAGRELGAGCRSRCVAGAIRRSGARRRR